MFRWICAVCLLAVAGAASAGWATVAGSGTPDFIGSNASEVCAKFDGLRFATSGYPGQERLYYKLAPRTGYSGSEYCAMYLTVEDRDADTAGTAWWDAAVVMDCVTGTDPPTWACATADDPTPVGSFYEVVSYIPPGTGGESTMSVGWITDLSPAQGGEIAGAILAIWALGWGFRALIRVLRETDGETNHESE